MTPRTTNNAPIGCQYLSHNSLGRLAYFLTSGISLYPADMPSLSTFFPINKLFQSSLSFILDIKLFKWLLRVPGSSDTSGLFLGLLVLLEQVLNGFL